MGWRDWLRRLQKQRQQLREGRQRERLRRKRRRKRWLKQWLRRESENGGGESQESDGSAAESLVVAAAKAAAAAKAHPSGIMFRDGPLCLLFPYSLEKTGRKTHILGVCCYSFLATRLTTLKGSQSLQLREESVRFCMMKIKSYVVIAFCYRKANILQRWSNILHIFYENKGRNVRKSVTRIIYA